MDATSRGAADPRVRQVFDYCPRLVIWEVTRACALACVHCRADANPRRDPLELTTEEGRRLIDEIAEFGSPPPLLVLTGGDPMLRKDLEPLVEHATLAGLHVALTPSGTAAATKARLAALKDAGVRRVAVSLDGPDPESHDSFRRVRGSWAWTMRIIDAAVALGLPLQINTTVTAGTLDSLRETAARVAGFPLSMWAVFFLIQTGRGADLDDITARQCEDLLVFLHDFSSTAPFIVKTTEAPHFRRVAIERSRAAGPPGRPGAASPWSVNDGNGLMFVDHVGGVYPSGFLPIARGRVQTGSLRSIYRNDSLFRALRQPDDFEGRCGRCRYRDLCGGSRSRAYAASGNPLGSDPLCLYDPAGHEPALRP